MSGSPESPGSGPSDGGGERVEITVARIGRAHGLHGDVFLDVRTDEPERRFAPGSSFATRRGVLVLEATRWHGARLLAKFARVSDRAAAEQLRGIELRVDVPADLRPDDPEEFYDHQLRGLTAHVDGGEQLGRVSDVVHLPGQDLLVLDVEGAEVLVPFVAEIVTTVDLDSGRVEIADRPGLLGESSIVDGELDE
jgi:16S rRNA processing protein RimM